MPIAVADYSPPFPFKNGHMNTIYSSLARKRKPVAFKRKRIETEDNDFLDIDFIAKGNKKIAVLCHGLECSMSQNTSGPPLHCYQKTDTILQQ